jgi:hypothetical protein
MVAGRVAAVAELLSVGMSKPSRSFSDPAVSCISFIFVCAGIWLLIAASTSVWYWCRTGAQVQVEARVLSVEKRYRRHGFSTEARFAYEFGGHSFTTDKVALFFSETGQYYGPLSEALRNRQTIRVYIDPSNPSLAVLDRELRFWPFAVGILFILFFLTSGIFVLRHQVKKRKMPNRAILRIAA